MNKAGYLLALKASPYAFPRAEGWTPDDPAWIAEGWDLPEIQDTVGLDLVEEVRKWPPEPFLHDSMPLVLLLAEVLSAGQVIQLYVKFRERWPMCEPQLRDEFLVTFHRQTPVLPEPLTFEEIVERLDGDPIQAVDLMTRYYQHPALPAKLPKVPDKAVRLAMSWVERMVEVGWLADKAEFDHLLEQLGAGHDLMVEEGSFEWMGQPPQVRVAFRDEKIFCDPQGLIDSLEVFGARTFKTGAGKGSGK